MNRLLKEVTIEILQRCNSNCIFCSSNSTVFSKNEIMLNKIIEIVDFCKVKGAKTVNISGGEPLIHKNIFDIINYCLSQGLECVIYTSGNVANKTLIDLTHKVIDYRKMKLIFNYSSSKNEVYQQLIGSTNFNIENLNMALNVVIDKGINTEVHIVPNKINILYLYETVNYLKSIKVKKVSFLRLVNQGRAKDNFNILSVSHERLKYEINRIIEDFSDSNITIRGGVPFSSLLKNKCECFAGINKLIFRYDGKVFPCEAFKEAPLNDLYVLGSIYTDSLDSIWENHPVHKKLGLLKKRASLVNEPCPAQLLYI